jgi:hypothetical protein
MAEAKVASKVEAPVAADAQMRQRSTEGSATADSIAQAAPKPAPAPSPPAAKPAPRPPAREMQPSAPASEAAVAPLQKSAADADYGGLDTPEKWVARLRDLRKQGRLEEANRAYAEFRKRYPQYVLPADLQEGFRP